MLREVARAMIVRVAAAAGHGAHEHGWDASPPRGEAVTGSRKRRRRLERHADARRRCQDRIQVLAAATEGTQNALALAQDEVLPADLIEADDERPRRIQLGSVPSQEGVHPLQPGLLGTRRDEQDAQRPRRPPRDDADGCARYRPRR